MTDSRFYDRAGPFTLGEIAARIGAEVAKGDPADLKLTDVASLESAEAGDISLFSDAKYANAFAVTKASVVITSDKLATLPHGVVLLVVPNPRLAFAQVGHIFYPPVILQPGVRAHRPIHPTASIGEGTEIGAGAEIGPGAKVGANCRIGNNVVIGRGVEIGDNCAIGFTSHERKRCTWRVAASASGASPRKNATSPASASASGAVDAIATIGRVSRSRISRIIRAPAAPRSPITGNRRSVFAASRAWSSPAASLRLLCNFSRFRYAKSPCGDAREDRACRWRHDDDSRKSRANARSQQKRERLNCM